MSERNELAEYIAGLAVPGPPKRSTLAAYVAGLEAPKKKLDLVEEKHQRAVASYLDMRQPRLWWFHVPNERPDVIQASVLKTLGVKSGVPDIMITDRVIDKRILLEKNEFLDNIPWMTSELRLRLATVYVGTAIELKRPKGNKASDTQRAWLEILGERGWSCHVCKGAARAFEVIDGLYGCQAEAYKMAGLDLSGSKARSVETRLINERLKVIGAL
jgi:hypothetical protein